MLQAVCKIDFWERLSQKEQAYSRGQIYKRTFKPDYWALKISDEMGISVYRLEELVWEYFNRGLEIPPTQWIEIIEKFIKLEIGEPAIWALQELSDSNG